MSHDSMTKLEKLTFVYEYLLNLKTNYHPKSIDIDIAIKFIEEIKDSYIQDFK